MEGLRFPTRLPCLPPTLEGSTQLGARICPRRAWLARRQARCAEATRAKVEAPSEFESETGVFHQACFTSCHQLPQACFTSCHQGLSPKPTHGFILVGFNRQGPTWRHNLAIIGRSHFGARVLTSCKHIWSAADFKNGENAHKVSATEDDAQQMKGGGSSKAKS